MGISFTDKNNIPNLLKSLGHGHKEVEIGFFDDGKQQMIAGVHEFGADINVTDRMRKYLHTIGIHLRADTTQIRIPERSFLRSAYDDNIQEIEAKVENLLPQVLDSGIPVDTFMQMIGEEMRGKIRQQIVAVSDPPNTDVTVEQKGSSNPLVDTGSMIDSIDYRVK